MLVVSLLLHGALALWLTRIELAPPVRARAAMQLDELAWVETQEPEPETPEEQPTPPTPVEQRQPVKKRQPAAQATIEPSPAAASGNTESDVPGAPGTGESTEPQEPKKRATLVPGERFSMSLGTGGVTEAQRGTTLHNRPGEQPDQESLNAYTSERLSRQINSELRQHIGAAAVAVGNVPGHFKGYEKAMRGALPKAKIDMSPPGALIAKDIALGMLTAGAPSAEASNKVANSPMGRSISNGAVITPNIEDQRFRESGMQMMAFGEAMKEAVSKEKLRTVLEMTTDATGALADVSIIEKSGDPRFDESVLHFSRKVHQQLPDSDDMRLGTSWWKSQWQFTFEPPDIRVRLLNAWRVEGSAPAMQ